MSQAATAGDALSLFLGSSAGIAVSGGRAYVRAKAMATARRRAHVSFARERIRVIETEFQGETDVRKLRFAGFVGLTAGVLCLLALPRTTLAEDVVVAEAVADDQGAGSLCIASSQLSHDALSQLISQYLKIDGEVKSVDVAAGNANVGFLTMPGRQVAGRFPSEVATANGLHRCAGAYAGAYWPASIGLLALGGIFGNLCAAGELGCGPSDGGGGGVLPPSPPGPPGPPFVRPTPRPLGPQPTPPAVSPFR
jgi:hypothetical protein